MDENVVKRRPPYRIREAARELNVSDQAVRLSILRGDLEGFKLGGTWLILPESVDRLLRPKAGDAA
jgi:excisionase family DNA binding protein